MNPPPKNGKETVKFRSGDGLVPSESVLRRLAHRDEAVPAPTLNLACFAAGDLLLAILGQGPICLKLARRKNQSTLCPQPDDAHVLLAECYDLHVGGTCRGGPRCGGALSPRAFD